MDNVIRAISDIGPALRALRKKNGLTQNKLSKLTRVKQQTISAIENGSQRANLKTLFAILSALKLELIVQSRAERKHGYAPGKGV